MPMPRIKPIFSIFQPVTLTHIGSQSFLAKFPYKSGMGYFFAECIKPNLTPMHRSIFLKTAIQMKNAIFWDVKPCGSSKKRFLLPPFAS
jgi:hypothetical protein